TARPDETVREAAKRMDARGVGILVVVDEDARPVGALTDRDVVLRVLRRRRDPDHTKVSDVMQDEVSVVREASPLALAARRMRADGVRRMPVVDEEGKLTGIVTVDDVLQLVSTELVGVAEAVRSQFPADLEGERALGPTTGG
ncbi:MAG: CBS domain-containing protein, partial [Myxococcota bacterium]